MTACQAMPNARVHGIPESGCFAMLRFRYFLQGIIPGPQECSSKKFLDLSDKSHSPIVPPHEENFCHYNKFLINTVNMVI
jgi:hypothetical protein